MSNLTFAQMMCLSAKPEHACTEHLTDRGCDRIGHLHRNFAARLRERAMRYALTMSAGRYDLGGAE